MLASLRSSVLRRPRKAGCLRRIDARFARFVPLGRPATASKGGLPAAHWMLASLGVFLPAALVLSLPSVARRLLAYGAGILADARRDGDSRAPFGALDGSLPTALVLSLRSRNPRLRRWYSRSLRSLGVAPPAPPTRPSSTHLSRRFATRCTRALHHGPSVPPARASSAWGILWRMV